MATHGFRNGFDPNHCNRYDSWSLMYCMSPGLFLKVGDVDGKWSAQEPFTAYMIPAGVSFWERDELAPGKLAETVGLAFCVNAEVGLETYLHSRRQFASFRDPARLLRDRLVRMSELGRDAGNAAHWPAFAELCEIIATIHQSRRAGDGAYEIQTPARPQQSSKFVDKVRTHIEEHLGESLSMELLARAMHVSRSTLSHRYKGETGESPHRTQVRLRIERAKGLMQEGEPVKAAALATGFCDEFHFSRVFQQFEGMRPSAFLKIARDR